MTICSLLIEPLQSETPGIICCMGRVSEPHYGESGGIRHGLGARLGSILVLLDVVRPWYPASPGHTTGLEELLEQSHALLER
jgi:hypothetical protein